MEVWSQPCQCCVLVMMIVMVVMQYHVQPPDHYAYAVAACLMPRWSQTRSFVEAHPTLNQSANDLREGFAEIPYPAWEFFGSKT
jgi:hypothetical protein